MYAGGAGLSSLAAGQGMGSLAQLGTYAPSTVMSNIGTGIGRGVTGATNLMNKIPGVNIGGEGTISNNPAWGGIESLGKTVAGGGEPLDIEKFLNTSGNILTGGGINPQDPWTDRIMDIAMNRTPQGIKDAAFQDARNPLQKFGDWIGGQAQEAFTPGTPDDKGNYPVNWKGPLAIGTAAGLAQAAMPKDVMPQDTSGIDIAGIRSRALTGSDPDLHFLPPAEATTAYAQGGRTGYYAGDMVEQKENIIKAFSAYKNQGGVKDFRDWFSGEYLPERPDMTRAPDKVDPWAEGV